MVGHAVTRPVPNYAGARKVLAGDPVTLIDNLRRVARDPVIALRNCTPAHLAACPIVLLDAAADSLESVLSELIDLHELGLT